MFFNNAYLNEKLLTNRISKKKRTETKPMFQKHFKFLRIRNITPKGSL